MSYEIIWARRGVIKRYFGHVTTDDLVQSVVDVEKDARFDSLRYCINDFLGITGISSSPQDIEDISALDKGASFSNPRIRIAVVTTSPEVVALATEYANSALNSYPTKIFSSLDDANAWLADSHA
jgi:hypothetical protein